MSYPSRHELPRSYVPTPPVPSHGQGMRGPAAAGGLVMGSASGVTSAGLYPRVAHPVGSAPASAGPGSSGVAPSPHLMPTGDIPIRVLVKPELLITPMALGPVPQVPPPRNSAKFDFEFERDFIAQAEREVAAAGAAASCSGSSGVGAGASATQQSAGDRGGAQGMGASGSAEAPMVSELQRQLEHERAGFGDRGDGKPSSLLDGGVQPQNGFAQGLKREQQELQEHRRQQQLSPGPVLDPAAAEYIAMGYSSDAVHLALAIHSGTTQTKVIDFCSAFSQLSEMGFAPEEIAGVLSLYDNDRDRALAHLAPGL